MDKISHYHKILSNYKKELQINQKGDSPLGIKWKGFISILFEPTNLLLLIGTIIVGVLTIIKSGDPNVQEIIALFSILLSILTGFLGARIDRVLTSRKEMSILETRGRSAIRDLDMISHHVSELYTRVTVIEKRMMIEKAIDEHLEQVQYSDRTLEILCHLRLFKRMLFKSIKDWKELVPKSVQDVLNREYDNTRKDVFDQEMRDLETVSQWSQTVPTKKNGNEEERITNVSALINEDNREFTNQENISTDNESSFLDDYLPPIEDWIQDSSGRKIPINVSSGSPTTDMNNLIFQETLNNNIKDNFPFISKSSREIFKQISKYKPDNLPNLQDLLFNQNIPILRSSLRKLIDNEIVEIEIEHEGATIHDERRIKVLPNGEIRYLKIPPPYKTR